MSETLEAVKRLVTAGELRISEHGYDELAEDDIAVRDILSGVEKAVVVKTIQISQKDRLCWCYNLIKYAVRSTLCGGSRKGGPVRQFL